MKKKIVSRKKHIVSASKGAAKNSRSLNNRLRKKAGRACSQCGVPGHNSRTCGRG